MPISNKDILRDYIEHPFTSTIHLDTSNWVYRDMLEAAASELDNAFNDANVNADTRIENGRYVVKDVKLFDGSLLSLTHLWQCNIRMHICKYKIVNLITSLLMPLLQRIDDFLVHPHLPFYRRKSYKRTLFSALDDFIRDHVTLIPKMFITRVQEKQKRDINLAFQKVCLTYPYIVHELIASTSCYGWIKPTNGYIIDGEYVKNMSVTPFDIK